MKRFYALILLTISYSFCIAQSSGVILGSVIDAENQAALYASVVLYAASDSALVKGAITDEEGRFSINTVPKGSYFLGVSYVGFASYTSSVFSFNETNYDCGEILLEVANTELTEVTIAAERPIMEVRSDMVVLNVDKTVNAVGENALNLLRKSPGVMVDNNENVTLMGKTGVQVYIDGKPSPMGAADLAAYLKTIPSEQIDAIEIISNPSAKYDAEGNAGIINIRLKKDTNLGGNANLSLGFSQGEVPQYNGSITANYRNKKLNIFGNYSYFDGENTNFFNIRRVQTAGVFDGGSVSNNTWQGHGFKFGTDFYLDNKNTIGFMVNGNITDWTNSSLGTTVIESAVQDTILRAENDSDGDNSNYNFNVNYRFDDKKGNVINIDGDYGQYRSDALDFQNNFYTNPSGNTTYRSPFYVYEPPTDIDIWTFKIDYEKPLFGGKIETGIKTAFVNTDNTFDAYDVVDGVKFLDINRSNNFVYKENVNAAYAKFSTKIEKWGYQAGLRVEQTNSEGILTSMVDIDDDKVKRNYVDYFPSAGLSYQLNDKNSFQLSYSRRINRPSYQDLNPFEDQLDELTFQKGNPFLRPEYTNNIQLNHTFMYALNTTLSFSRTKDVITAITDTLRGDASFLTSLNIDQQRHYSINIASPVPINDWWSAYISLSGYRIENEAMIDGKSVSIAANTFNIYSQHSIKLPADFTFEVSGWYNSSSIWGGTFITDPMWSMDAGVQKRLFAGKGNLKLSVSDIFKTQVWSGISNFGDLYMETSGGWDSRRFKVNFSYMFGNDKVKSRRRSTGLEDEKNRIKSDN